MKVKVEYWSFYGVDAGFYVFKRNWLWGWEHYDHIKFPTLREAMDHAREIKQLEG